MSINQSETAYEKAKKIEKHLSGAQQFVISNKYNEFYKGDFASTNTPSYKNYINQIKKLNDILFELDNLSSKDGKDAMVAFNSLDNTDQSAAAIYKET